MKPEEFRKLWITDEDHLLTYPLDVVKTLSISRESKQFLIEAGLPESAAPFLSFGPKTGNIPLVAVSEFWDLPISFNCYRIIGSTGNGDSICIDEPGNGSVVYLNHDNNFMKVFINSSVIHLAESLLAYRDFVSEIISTKGENAYLDGDIPQRLIDCIIDKIGKIDEMAIRKKCFWVDDLQVTQKA